MSAITKRNLPITHVERGSPTGDFIRKYWIPAAQSSELQAGGPPVRLMLLGERLIGFREGSGKAVIMDHQCPHRRASLFFGICEDDGIRCPYHGIKFAADGQCLDIPQVPADKARTSGLRANAYRTVESHGVVYVYMGDEADLPPLPPFAALQIPEEDVRILMVQRECNWLQALEGDIDTAHFSFLHAGRLSADQVPEDQMARYALIDPAPRYEVADTNWGTMYAAYRAAEPGQTYWRFAHYLFPFWTLPPGADLGQHITLNAWVPMDDKHTMFVSITWKKSAMPFRYLKDGSMYPGVGAGTQGTLNFLPNTTDWFGRWRLAQNASNDYGIDRSLQHGENWSGIQGIHLQDQAVTESMGAVVDHAKEHLLYSDLMIVRTRRRFARAAVSVQEGAPAPFRDDTAVAASLRAGDCIASATLGWDEVYQEFIGEPLDLAEPGEADA